VFFNLFAAAEPSANDCNAHGTLRNDPSYNRIELWLRISSQAISVRFGGTLRLLGTPGEKHCCTPHLSSSLCRLTNFASLLLVCDFKSSNNLSILANRSLLNLLVQSWSFEWKTIYVTMVSCLLGFIFSGNANCERTISCVTTLFIDSLLSIFVKKIKTAQQTFQNEHRWELLKHFAHASVQIQIPNYKYHSLKYLFNKDFS